MRFSSTIVASTAALASFASAQGNANFTTGLVALLTQNNLTTLLGIATQLPALLPVLASGNKTVFAPTNAAFAALNQSTLANPQAVLQLIEYHILQGSFPVSSLSNSSHTIAQTLLTNGTSANLPGNGTGQAIVLVPETNGSVTVVGATSNVSSIANTTFQNLDIYIIDTLLTLPQNVTTTAAAANLTSLVGAIQMYAPAAVNILDTNKGITVFAPDNAAFSAVASAVSTLNSSQISNVLLNHVLTSQVVYSTLLSNSTNATTASGESLSFITNSTGAYVVSGSIVARIIRSDVIVSNGVVHVIDNVLANTASNTTAANSANSSAISAASTIMPATGAVGGRGATATATSGGTTSGSTASPTTTSTRSGAIASASLANAAWLGMAFGLTTLGLIL